MDKEIIELYKNSDLPKEGWLQSCFLCKTYTSRTTHITNIESEIMEYNFFCFVCKECKYKFKKNEILYFNFLRDCKIYIHDKYNFLITR